MKNGGEIKHLIINTYDIKGGAAAATYRLHRALIGMGIDSKMLVQFKDSDDYTVMGPETNYERIMGKLRARLDKKPLKLYKEYNKYPWSVSWLPHNISKKIKNIDPDIVHINWIGEGYIPIKELAFIDYPMIWTLHDMWPFTGGCHYSYECSRYVKSCGQCPQLGSSYSRDLSNRIWKKKRKYWKNLNLCIVSPSRWLANCAKESSLFGKLRIEVIPYVIDLDVFKPIDKKTARNILNLAEDKILILFGGLGATSDKRKGLQFLIPAIEKITANNKGIEICVFGASKPKNPVELNCNINYLGLINDYITLAIIYSAVDVFVAPSIQDNLPNTVIESLACGTPVVSFNIGGNPDMIDHKLNGYLSSPFDVHDLELGIRWVIEDRTRLRELSRNARKKAEKIFNKDIVASKYIKLFKELI